jgi:8-amino-7-oxononanoate synthase
VLVNFSSNDYLGLGETAARGATGSGASALVCGYQPVHCKLEARLAEFLERDAVLLTSSGYAANLAAVTALAGRGDQVVQDRRCHASRIDATRLSGARLKRYAHADAAAASERLKTRTGHTLLVTDGVFSMDGDEAPLAGLAAAAADAGATLLVDDAHGIGVLGQRGAGLLEELGLGQAEVPVLVGTLGKAFGCAGAFVAGSTGLIEQLVNEGRSVIYSTAMSPAMAHAGLAALDRIRSEPALRERLRDNISRFRAGARRRGLTLMDSRTPIQPLLLGPERRALAVSARLEAAGFLVSAIRPPTVPPGTSRLRITLSAAHEPRQIERLLDALRAAVRDVPADAAADRPVKPPSRVPSP